MGLRGRGSRSPERCPEGVRQAGGQVGRAAPRHWGQADEAWPPMLRRRH